MRKLGAISGTAVLGLLWASHAIAQCGPGGQPCIAAPEFDGSVAIAVVSLLASVCALVYSRLRH
jgi:hypothetical protein